MVRAPFYRFVITRTADARFLSGMLQQIPNAPSKCVTSNTNVLLCDIIVGKNYTLLANDKHTVRPATSSTA